jgi:hypothetical protein
MDPVQPVRGQASTCCERCGLPVAGRKEPYERRLFLHFIRFVNVCKVPFYVCFLCDREIADEDEIFLTKEQVWSLRSKRIMIKDLSVAAAIDEISVVFTESAGYAGIYINGALRRCKKSSS